MLVFFGHGQGLAGLVAIGFPALLVGGLCLLIAACLKIFQSKEENPKTRRRLAVAGILLLALAFISPALSPLVDRVLRVFS